MVMDNSPELTAVDLNAPYKKLLEYNDVVLAGTEHSKVRWAQCVSEYEFEYIKKRRQAKNENGCIHKSR